MKRLKSISFGIALVMLMLLPAIVAAGTMIEGTVMSAGASSLFIVSANGEHMEIVVPANTRIMRNGESAKLDDLQKRDQVTVAAAESGEGRVATEIFARSPL